MKSTATHKLKFTDKFCILGFTPEILSSNPLPDAKPTILQYFPQNNESESSWKYDRLPGQEALGSLCFPSDVVLERIEEKDLGQFRVPEPRFHSLILTAEDGKRSYGHVLHFVTLSKSESESSEHSVAASVAHSKALLLLTEHPYTNITKLILTELLELANENFTIENHIFNIINELFIPKTATNLKACPTKTPFVISRPDLKNELESCHVNLSEVIFEVGGIKSWLNLITAILLEKQIVIKSKSQEQIFKVMHALEHCIQPFQWPYNIILPVPQFGPKPSAEAYFDNPLTHILGYVVSDHRRKKRKLSAANSFIDENDLMCSSSSKCIVDLVEKKVLVGSDMGDVDTTTARMPPLPGRDVLEKHIKQAFLSYEKQRERQGGQNETSQNEFANDCASDDLHSSGHPSSSTYRSFLTQDQIDNYKFNTMIKEIHFSCFIQIFHNYDKFCSVQIFSSQSRSQSTSIISQNANTNTNSVSEAEQDESQNLKNNANNEREQAETEYYKSHDSNRIFEHYGFVADQPANCRKFLNEFVHSQIFMNFIDDKVRNRRENDGSEAGSIITSSYRLASGNDTSSETGSGVPIPTNSDSESTTSLNTQNSTDSSSILSTYNLSSETWPFYRLYFDSRCLKYKSDLHSVHSNYSHQDNKMKIEDQQKSRFENMLSENVSNAVLLYSKRLDEKIERTIVCPKVTPRDELPASRESSIDFDKNLVKINPTIKNFFYFPEVDGSKLTYKSKSRPRTLQRPSSHTKKSSRSRLEHEAGQNVRDSPRSRPRRKPKNSSTDRSDPSKDWNWQYDTMSKMIAEIDSITKRIILNSIPKSEALVLGYAINQDFFSTLVGQLCDKLDRIFKHGLNGKIRKIPAVMKLTEGRSDFWIYLTYYFVKTNERKEREKISIEEERIKNERMGVGSGRLFGFFKEGFQVYLQFFSKSFSDFYSHDSEPSSDSSSEYSSISIKSLKRNISAL